MNLSEEKALDSYLLGCRQTMVEDICRLVRIPSIRGEKLPCAPFGEGPAHALMQAVQIAQRLGFSAGCVENCVGVVLADAPLEGLDILAHLDVVVAGDGWKMTDAFQPRIQDGRIYGRGAADNKGPAIAVLYALAAVLSLGKPLKRRVRILWGTAEETGSEDLPLYYAQNAPAPMTVTPDAAFPVITTEKGRLEGQLSAPYQQGPVLKVWCHSSANAVPAEACALISGKAGDPEALLRLCPPDAQAQWAPLGENYQITVRGRACHGAAPQKGVNALTALLQMLNGIEQDGAPLKALAEAFPHGDFSAQALGIAQSEAVSGALTISLNNLLWQPDGGLEATFDCRVPVGGDDAGVTVPLERRFAAKNIQLQGRLIPPHRVPEDSPFVRTLLGCWEDCTGEKTRPRAIAGNTYAHGIPGAVAFGFADPEIRTGTHGPDEYVEISQLLLGARVYARAIARLCLE